MKRIARTTCGSRSQCCGCLYILEYGVYETDEVMNSWNEERGAIWIRSSSGIGGLLMILHHMKGMSAQHILCIWLCLATSMSEYFTQTQCALRLFIENLVFLFKPLFGDFEDHSDLLLHPVSNLSRYLNSGDRDWATSRWLEASPLHQLNKINRALISI